MGLRLLQQPAGFMRLPILGVGDGRGNRTDGRAGGHECNGRRRDELCARPGHLVLRAEHAAGPVGDGVHGARRGVQVPVHLLKYGGVAPPRAAPGAAVAAAGAERVAVLPAGDVGLARGGLIDISKLVSYVSPKWPARRASPVLEVVWTGIYESRGEIHQARVVTVDIRPHKSQRSPGNCDRP